jgi:prepilin-type N-terminal cleavage/methylation domain-containing protein
MIITRKNSPESLTRSGFTLMETLVSLGVLAIIVLVTISTFLTVMVKQSKVEVVKAVESDGKYAMRLMLFMIRNCRDILENTAGQTCPGGATSMSSIKIQNPDDGETEFFCASGHIASASAFPDGATEYYELTSSEVSLVDCNFSCTPGEFNKPDKVEIGFTLSQAGSSGRVEEEASLDFHSAVTTRNY